MLKVLIKKTILSCLIISSTYTSIIYSQKSATEIIDLSIEFHDPYSNWHIFSAELDFTVERPDKSSSNRRVIMNNAESSFNFYAQYEEGILNYKVLENIADAMWNNNRQIPEEYQKKYRISKDRALMYRDYYAYLYGMPMKLKDKGTIVDPDVQKVSFHGEEYYRVKVNYEESVGSDTWYFYFDPYTYAMEAYQFYHDESANDGEYILFEEIVEKDKIMLPRIRKWYYNQDSTYLGTDILE